MRFLSMIRTDAQFVITDRAQTLHVHALDGAWTVRESITGGAHMIRGVDFYPRYPYNKPRCKSVLRESAAPRGRTHTCFKNRRNKDCNHIIAFQKGIDHETYRDPEYP